MIRTLKDNKPGAGTCDYAHSRSWGRVHVITIYLPSQELVDNTTKREPVSSEGVLNALFDHLRGHVAMGPTDHKGQTNKQTQNSNEISSKYLQMTN